MLTLLPKVLGAAAALGLLGSVVSFNLWQGAKEDLAAEAARCNMDKIEAVASAERSVRLALEGAHARELEERDRRLEIERRVRGTLTDKLEDAAGVLAGHENTIARLRREAAHNEIPDGGTCLNAFLPWPTVEWLCEQGARDAESRGGRDRGGSVCSDTGRPDRADPSGADFAGITYGGSLTRWGQDRRGLMECNARLSAIAGISSERLGVVTGAKDEP